MQFTFELCTTLERERGTDSQRFFSFLKKIAKVTVKVVIKIDLILTFTSMHVPARYERNLIWILDINTWQKQVKCQSKEVKLKNQINFIANHNLWHLLIKTTFFSWFEMRSKRLQENCLNQIWRGTLDAEVCISRLICCSEY